MRSLLATLNSLGITLLAVAVLGLVAVIVFGCILFERCVSVWKKGQLRKAQPAIVLQVYTNRRT